MLEAVLKMRLISAWNVSGTSVPPDKRGMRGV
jgi:hypothetical protein